MTFNTSRNRYLLITVLVISAALNFLFADYWFNGFFSSLAWMPHFKSAHLELFLTLNCIAWAMGFIVSTLALLLSNLHGYTLRFDEYLLINVLNIYCSIPITGAITLFACAVFEVIRSLSSGFGPMIVITAIIVFVAGVIGHFALKKGA